MIKFISATLTLLMAGKVLSQEIKYKRELIFICNDSTQTDCKLSRESFYENSLLLREKSYDESGKVNKIVVYENTFGKAVKKMSFNSDSIVTNESIMAYDSQRNHLSTSNYSISDGQRTLTGENIYSYDSRNFLISNEGISLKVGYRSLVEFKNDDYGNCIEIKWIIKQGKSPATSAEFEKHKYEYDKDKRIIKDTHTGVTFGKEKFEFVTQTIYDARGNKINVKKFKSDRQLNSERKYFYNLDNLIEKYIVLDSNGHLKESKLYKYVY